MCSYNTMDFTAASPYISIYANCASFLFSGMRNSTELKPPDVIKEHTLLEAEPDRAQGWGWEGQATYKERLHVTWSCLSPGPLQFLSLSPGMPNRMGIVGRECGSHAGSGEKTFR